MPGRDSNIPVLLQSTNFMNRSMGDADGPLVAEMVYKRVLSEECLAMDTVPYALDEAVQSLRRRQVEPARWATYIHVGI